jgi:hypothetical protein
MGVGMVANRRSFERRRRVGARRSRCNSSVSMEKNGGCEGQAHLQARGACENVRPGPLIRLWGGDRGGGSFRRVEVKSGAP